MAKDTQPNDEKVSAASADDALTPEEQALLAALSGEGDAAEEAPEAVGAQEKPPANESRPPAIADQPSADDDGLSPEERAMFASQESSNGASAEPREPAATEEDPAPSAPTEGDDGLTPEERAMLEALSGEVAPPVNSQKAPAETETPSPEPVGGPLAAERPPESSEPEAQPETNDAAAEDDSLTPEEREMLASLSGEAAPAADEDSQQAAPERVEAASDEPDALSPQEKAILASARAEGERVAREELPGMFGKGRPPATGPDEETPYLAQTLPDQVDEEDATRVPLWSRMIAAPFDAVNYPFRGISPTIRLGLGLSGVLLLLTLALVKLFQFLAG